MDPLWVALASQGQLQKPVGVRELSMRLMDHAEIADLGVAHGGHGSPGILQAPHGKHSDVSTATIEPWGHFGRMCEVC